MRLITKSQREQSREIQFSRLIEQGYTRETYKTIDLFTLKGEKYFTLKVFSGTAANHVHYVNYRTEERLNEVVTNFKASADRQEVRKAEQKANPRTTGAAACSAAVKEELKKVFPGIKFSVKSSNFSMGDSVDISWEDGPTTAEVEEFTRKYQYGHFNGMEDMYENTNQRDDIPQSKYVHTSRHISEEMRKFLIPILTELMGDYEATYWEHKPENLVGKIYYRTSFPAGAVITGIERTDCTCGSIEEFYKISYTAPNAPAEVAPVEVPKGKVQIIEYSAKSIAVIGETIPIKDKLKELGGAFNYRLTCGAGWIFSKSKLDALKAALS